MISEALRDMDMAGRELDPVIFNDIYWEMVQGEKDLIPEEKLILESMSVGKTIRGLGDMMTPADTPVEGLQHLKTERTMQIDTEI